MKNSRRLVFTFALGLAAVAFASAKDQAPMNATGTLQRVSAKPTPEQAAWLTTARAAYPLTTCVVSGDELEGGDMGKPVEYIYKEEGKPDRLVRFCCKDCVDDFKKDPAKYLAAIDDANVTKAEGTGAHSHH